MTRCIPCFTISYKQ